MFTNPPSLLALFITVLIAVSPARGENVFEGPWPLLPAGEKPAEGEIWGELPNGLRYAVVPTNAPADAVSLRLLVAAGRVHERKGKAGTAYLLQELLASGTENFSYAERFQFLLENGIDPQSSGWVEVDLDHSVFRLDLDEPEGNSLADAMRFLVGIAGSPTFGQEELDLARAAIAYRASRGGRSYLPKSAEREGFLLKDSKYSHIGDKLVAEEIGSIELEDVKSYWESLYKPNRMVLLVAGVVEPSEVERLISAAFGGLESSLPLMPMREPSSRFRSTGDLESDVSRDGISRLAIFNVLGPADLFDEGAEADYYVTDFLGRVAQSYAGDAKRLAVSPLAVQSGELTLTIGGRSSAGQVLGQLRDGDKALHRLADYGIRSEDLEAAKRDYLRLRGSYDLELSTRGWPKVVAERLARSVLDQVPFRHGETFAAFLEKVISPLGFEEVRSRCKDLFAQERLSIYLELPKGFSLGANAIGKRLKASRKGYDFSWEQAGTMKQDWAFDSGFPSGGMVESTKIMRIGEYPVLQYEFSNNVRMNLVRTDLFPGRVQVHVSLGNGLSDMANLNPAFAALARTVLIKSKLPMRGDSPSITEVLESKGIEDVDVGLNLDQLYWSGLARDEEGVADFFSGIVHWMFGSRLEEETFDSALENLQGLAKRNLDASAMVRVDGLLAAEDPRFREFFVSDDLEGIDFVGMRDWLRAVRESAYIEITVVGDVAPRTVLRDARKTFGSAPGRTGKVFQPRHGAEALWSEPGIARETLKTSENGGYVTFVFPQVGEKSCLGDRRAAVFLPLLKEHLSRALSAYPALEQSLVVDLEGERMVPLSQALKVQLRCEAARVKEAEGLLLAAVDSFAESLEREWVRAAERNAWLELKRIALNGPELVQLFKQSQGKPYPLACVLELLEGGFTTDFDVYQSIAARQFSAENLRGVVVVPEGN